MWLKANHYRSSGIETHPSCINTGHAPAAFHYHKQGEDVYLVGKTGDICWSSDMRIKGVVASWSKKHACVGDFGTIHIYKSMTSARAKYDALCYDAIATRMANNEHVQSLIAKARQGDLDAKLELFDWI